MKRLPATGLAAGLAVLAVSASAALAQVANEADPFASRFDQRTNFQIKFKTPE